MHPMRRIVVGALFLLLFGSAALPAFAQQPTLSLQGTFETNIFDEGAAEIGAYDVSAERFLSINADASTLDVIDISDPTAPSRTAQIAVGQLAENNSAGFAAGDVNSVDVNASGLIAVAVEADVVTDLGRVVLLTLDASDSPTVVDVVEVGALPDGLRFTPDGTTVIVANEGEPDDGVDPEGSISVIDVSDPNNVTVDPILFTTVGNLPASVRIFGNPDNPNPTVAEDLEPEYVTATNTTAFVSIQENNAVAVVDLSDNSFEIQGLGFKDQSLSANGFGGSNGLDASDKDDAINIQTYDNVFGMYQPDALVAATVGGTDYVLTANEGDARDFEEVRVEDLILDPAAFSDASIQDPDQLGRLEVTNTLGVSESPSVDGVFAELDGDQQVPPVTTDAEGFSRMTYDDDTGVLTYSVVVEDLDFGSFFERELLAEDFSDDALAPFTAFSVASDKDWGTSSDDNPPNAPYAAANGFLGDEPSNDWLISPAIDMASAEDETLTFRTAKEFDDSGGRGLNVLVSTDYSGSGDPTAATWTDISDRVTFATDLTFTESGEIDLTDAAFQETDVYIAFQYESSGTGSEDTERWRLDDIALTGTQDATTDPDDDVVSMHIHNADRGSNGGVAFGVISPAQDADVTFSEDADGRTVISGTWDPGEGNSDASAFPFTTTDVGTDLPLYWNIHTEANTGGEIRGQLVAADVYDELYAYGARSFSVHDGTGARVFDSGDGLEQLTATELPTFFNSDNDENDSFDSRSDAKGPEPEAITVGEVDGTPYAFVGLERVGGIAVYDITDPTAPAFVEYVNNRDFTVDDVENSVENDGAVGDLGPESIVFIPAADNPNSSSNLVVVSNEVSGTVSLFTFDAPEPPPALLISEVADPADESEARFVEIYNGSGETIDLGAGGWHLSRQANAGNISDIELTGTLQPGAMYLVGRSSFESFYGFPPDVESGSISGNGDDGYFLYRGGDSETGTLVDAYGVLDQDGSGEPWEYENSQVTRNGDVTVPSPTWTASEWTITNGANAADMTPGSTLLPVELTAFAGTVNAAGIALEWTTASETNNAGFHVEHRAPGAETFAQIGFRDGRGTTAEAHTYMFRLKDVAPGVHRFRLRQVDTDGAETVSKTITVQATLDGAYRLSDAYPNPARQMATLDLAVRETQEVRVDVYNLLGQRVVTLFDGTARPETPTTLTMDTDRLSSGMYFVRVNGEQFQATRKVTVVR
mgnify:CR=1 FL=1